MSTIVTSADDLLLAIRQHTVHESPVRVEVVLRRSIVAIAGAEGSQFTVSVFDDANNVDLCSAQGESLVLAASKLLRDLNAERDRRVTELRRQVAKLTGDAEVAA